MYSGNAFGGIRDIRYPIRYPFFLSSFLFAALYRTLAPKKAYWTTHECIAPMRRCSSLQHLNETLCIWCISIDECMAPMRRCSSLQHLNETLCIWCISIDECMAPMSCCASLQHLNETLCIWCISISVVHIRRQSQMAPLITVLKWRLRHITVINGEILTDGLTVGNRK